MTGSQTLKLIHDRFKGKAPAEVLQELASDMTPASKGNREIPQHLGKAMEDLSALRVKWSCLNCPRFDGRDLGLHMSREGGFRRGLYAPLVRALNSNLSRYICRSSPTGLEFMGLGCVLLIAAVFD